MNGTGSLFFDGKWKRKRSLNHNYIDRKNEEIDRLIKKKEQFISELENYKKSLIYEYVTGKKEVPES